MMYSNDLLQMVIMFVIVLIVSIILAIFSPFNIFFIIFSIIRQKTKSIGLKRASLVFQIILSILNMIVGILIALLFSIRSSGFYMYNQGIFATIGVIIGIGFVSMLQIGFIIWQSSKLRQED